jgi:hypothetical protein
MTQDELARYHFNRLAAAADSLNAAIEKAKTTPRGPSKYSFMYTREQKLAAVEGFLNHHGGLRTYARKTGISIRSLRNWIHAHKQDQL